MYLLTYQMKKKIIIITLQSVDPKTFISEQSLNPLTRPVNDWLFGILNVKKIGNQLYLFSLSVALHFGNNPINYSHNSCGRRPNILRNVQSIFSAYVTFSSLMSSLLLSRSQMCMYMFFYYNIPSYFCSHFTSSIVNVTRIIAIKLYANVISLLITCLSITWCVYDVYV